MIHHLYVHKPCSNCPFRTDCTEGWLGKTRMLEITQAETFTCHKTEDPKRRQCAGHMLTMGESNAFVRLAKALDLTLDLTGEEYMFKSVEDLIRHHE